MYPDRPQARTLPSSDRVFGRVVERILDEAGSAGDLETRLRMLYPRAAVSEGQLSGAPRLLYVYRDGRYEANDRERWWDQPGVPRATMDARSGRFVDANDGWASLMHGDRAGLVGRHYTDFVLPEALDAARTLFATVVELGEAHSQALLRRPDGSSIAMEFHAVLDGDVVSVAYRELR